MSQACGYLRENPQIAVSPQKVRKILSGCPADDVETVGNVVELVGEEVPIEVQRHPRALVPEHLLDDLRVAPAAMASEAAV